MRRNFRRLTAALLAAVLVFAALPMGAVAVTTQEANDAFVQEIAHQIIQGKNSFSVNYTGAKLDETMVSSSIRQAIALSLDSLFSVKSYTVRTVGRTASIELSRSRANNFAINYAANWDDAVAILQRTVMQMGSGINIYLEDTANPNNVAYIQQQAYQAYETMLQQPWDDYNAYLVNSVSYSITQVSARTGGYFITYEPTYNETPEQKSVLLSFVGDTAQMLMRNAQTDREKIEALNRFVCAYASYLDTGSTTDLSAFYLMTRGTAVCQGYALLTHALLREMGFTCRIVTGTAKSLQTGQTGSHMWNAVYVDKQWLHLDTTWNDSQSDPTRYLLVTADQISADHIFDTTRYSSQALTQAWETYQNKASRVVTLTIGNPYITVGNTSRLIDNSNKSVVPIIRQSRTLIPLRSLIESLGGRVIWDASQEKVTVYYRNSVVRLWIGSSQATVNGMAQQMDVAPIIQEGRTMLPIRFVCEMLGMNVQWHSGTQSVYIVAS